MANEIKKLTLEQIIEKEKQSRYEDGSYGIKACKESILFNERVLHTDLFTQLTNYVERANNDKFFNRAMVLACWELLQERLG